MTQPIPGRTYTTAEMFTKLNLLDTPHMGFYVGGRKTVLQDSHVTDEQLLSVPGMAELQWRYVRTTHEWIPVFVAVDDAAVLACVDIEDNVDPYCEDEHAGYWVTPKGHPREQYYRRAEDGSIVRTHDGTPYDQY